jgi:hypothetical protein
LTFAGRQLNIGATQAFLPVPRFAANIAPSYRFPKKDCPMFQLTRSRGRCLQWRHVLVSALLGALAAACCATAAVAQSAFTFRDAGNEAGLFPDVAGIAGHGAGWGDVDSDGFPELYVGTFGGHPYGSKNNMFFRNLRGKFQLDGQQPLRILGRNNGAILADLDNDGDLDLYVTHHAIDGKAYGQPHYSTPNFLFRNEGGGRFTDVSAASGACPAGFACRSAAVLDFDADGFLDLLVGEDFFQGGTSRTRLYRNHGGLQFDDATASAGLPDRVTGFGVAAADVTGDRWPDLLMGGRYGGNKLFINDGQGRFKEVPPSHANFEFVYKDTADDTACGVCFGDVNRDGLQDIVIGAHYDRPWYTGGVPIRLYLNRGMQGGWPKFDDVTESAGLIPLPMKSPHVEVQDFDNDGWPDIYTSIVKFTGGRPCPVIFKNLGLQGPPGSLPRFKEDALAMNDFPTETDKQTADVVAFFERMQREGKVVYTAAGPSGDYDRDGRLDLFLPNWWVASRSLLLKNETPGGNWLDVTVHGAPEKRFNRQGIGATVRVYPAGKLGQADSLMCAKEIAVGYGYASGQEAIAHIGLGAAATCDLEVVLPYAGKEVSLSNVKANQRVVVTPEN